MTTLLARQPVDPSRDVRIVDAFDRLQGTACNPSGEVSVTHGSIAHPTECRELPSADRISDDPHRSRGEAGRFGDRNQRIVPGCTSRLASGLSRESCQRLGGIGKSV